MTVNTILMTAKQPPAKTKTSILNEKDKDNAQAENNFDGDDDPDTEPSPHHLPQAVNDVLKLHLVICLQTLI